MQGLQNGNEFITHILHWGNAEKWEIDKSNANFKSGKSKHTLKYAVSFLYQPGYRLGAIGTLRFEKDYAKNGGTKRL